MLVPKQKSEQPKKDTNGKVELPMCQFKGSIIALGISNAKEEVTL